MRYNKILSIIIIIALSTIIAFAYNESTNLFLRLLEATDDIRPFREDFNYNFELVDDLFDDVSLIEFNYLNGVTSAIQTQLDAKQPLDAQLTDIAGLTPTDSYFIVGDGVNFVTESGATARASLGIDLTLYYLKTEMDSFSEIQAIISDKTLVNVEDGITATAIQDDLILKADFADEDWGDMTVGTNVVTIDSGAVTYAKIQNISATDKILGRSSAGAGVVEEIVCTSAGREIIDDADASAQRATLGLVIGTNVQASDASLTSIAGLTYASASFIKVTAEDTYAIRTLSEVRTDLGLVIGTNIMSWDAQLDDIAALAYTDGNFIVGDGSNWVAESGSTARTSLGLGNVENLKVKLDGTQAPTVNNDVDEGYAVGSRWFDVTNDKEYACLDNTDGAAVWTETTEVGYTNLTSFVDQTTWRLFYSNTDGDVTELPLGADGTYFTSTGAASAPTFSVPPGGGDVVKVGTPVNNQIGIWTGDGTIEGDANLTYDGTTLNLGTGQINFPDAQNASADTNTLDDYEEEEYTATLTCGTSGTITMNTDYDQLAYTKIGRKVTVQGRIIVDSVSSPLGALTLNLPFPVADLSETAGDAVGSISYFDINALGAAGAMAIRVLDGASSARIIEYSTTTQLHDVSDHIKAGTQLGLSITYFTD